MPQLSFVIPYYKKEKTLAKCLRSLFSQSLKDIEVIVVFDGKDLEGEQIAKRFKKVKLITIPHAGAPAARNAGLALATGEFVSFWDADCYIEPGAAMVWMQAFRMHPEVDFVYSGYKFPEGSGAISGEAFDPWTLQVNNYISGMFPIRRSKAPQWDETLLSLQDWDFWLRAVESGSKGLFLKGFAFKTEFPDPSSISGKGCTPENWLPRLEAVKTRHNIPLREACVSAFSSRDEGIALAKILDMDYRDYPTYFPNRYKTIVQVGFAPRAADQHAVNFKNPPGHGPDPRRVLFWRAVDVYSLRYEVAFEAIRSLATILNRMVHFQFCEDVRTRKALQDLGFKAIVLPLPVEFAEEIKPLPEAKKVVFDVAPDYLEFFKTIEPAFPDAEFHELKGAINIDDFRVLLQIRPERCVDITTKKALLAGRRVVSNIQSPYCGYFSHEQEEVEIGRKNLISTLRQALSALEPDALASAHWKEATSALRFRETFLGIVEKKEAVS